MLTVGCRVLVLVVECYGSSLLMVVGRRFCLLGASVGDSCVLLLVGCRLPAGC